MEKQFYSPMEKVLINAMIAREERKAQTTKEVCEAALETDKKFTDVLLLDVMLCQAEEKMGLLDGIPLEDWIESEGNE